MLNPTGKTEKSKSTELMHVFWGIRMGGLRFYFLLSTEGINTWLVPLEYY